MIVGTAGNIERPRIKSRYLQPMLDLLPPISSAADNPLENVQPHQPARHDYWLGAMSVCLVVAVYALLALEVPLFRYSIITATARLLQGATGRKWLATDFILLADEVMVAVIFWKLTKTRGAIPRAALWEEQMFRAGSEDWSLWQRVRSNAIFGCAHIFNFIVPIAIVPGLAMGGWWFMRVYRKSFRQSQSRIFAVQSSGAVHAAHNKLVVYCVAPCVIVGVIGYYILK